MIFFFKIPFTSFVFGPSSFLSSSDGREKSKAMQSTPILDTGTQLLDS
jgi:hypothetical protein